MLKLLEQDLNAIIRKYSWGGSIIGCQSELTSTLNRYKANRVIKAYHLEFVQNSNSFSITVQPVSRIQEIKLHLSFM